jgi:hypothetical protein
MTAKLHCTYTLKFQAEGEVTIRQSQIFKDYNPITT